MEISFCSHPNTNQVIATIFGTWHDSWAVVACAKFCCDMVISNWIRAKWNFHRIWIVMEKSLVKWAPGLLTHYWPLKRTNHWWLLAYLMDHGFGGFISQSSHSAELWCFLLLLVSPGCWKNGQVTGDLRCFIAHMASLWCWKCHWFCVKMDYWITLKMQIEFFRILVRSGCDKFMETGKPLCRVNVIWNDILNNILCQ